MATHTRERRTGVKMSLPAAAGIETRVFGTTTGSHWIDYVALMLFSSRLRDQIGRNSEP
jgi:hypothetical protein